MPTFFEVTAFLFIMILGRYFLVAGLAYFVVWKGQPHRFGKRKIQNRTPHPKIVQREIFWSILSSVVFALAGAVGFVAWQKGWTLVETDLRVFIQKYTVAMLPVSYLLLLVFHDTYFYWMHRLVHHPKLFKRVHKVHHDSVTPTPWAAFSFHPLEAILEAAILPILLIILPTHLFVIGAFLVTMTILGVINHLGYELYFKGFDEHPLTKWIISATHHDLHHQRFNGNYGLYFTIWDRVMKTDSQIDSMGVDEG